MGVDRAQGLYLELGLGPQPLPQGCEGRLIGKVSPCSKKIFLSKTETLNDPEATNTNGFEDHALDSSYTARRLLVASYGRSAQNENSRGPEAESFDRKNSNHKGLQLSLSIKGSSGKDEITPALLQNMLTKDQRPRRHLGLSLCNSSMQSCCLEMEHLMARNRSSSSWPSFPDDETSSFSICSSSTSSLSLSLESGGDIPEIEEVESRKRKRSGRPDVIRGEQTSTEMMVAGCSQCLIYVLVCKGDPKCPKCASSLLRLEFPAPPKENQD